MIIPFQFDADSLSSAGTILNTLARSPGVMLYVGPDQIMPLTSVLGAIVGVALMFWGRLVGFAIKCRDAVTKRGRPEQHEKG